MSMSGQTSAVFPFLKKSSHGLSFDIDLLPCAIAIWSKDRRHCVLNSAARKLTSLSDDYLRADPEAWLERIHTQDQHLFSAAWDRLRAGQVTESCDYRFSPQRDGKFLWLREISVMHRDAPSEIPWIVSYYIDAGSLKGRPGEVPANIQGIIGGLLHSVRNHLQTVRMGLDCLERLPAKPEDVEPLVNGIERVLASLRQLGDFFFPPEGKFLMADAGIVFEEVVRHMESALRHKNVRLRVEPRHTLPPVRIDPAQFRHALERVIEVVCALLPKGGELTIEAGNNELDGRTFIELKIVAFSAAGFSFDGRDLFRPFLRVNGYEVGLNIVIADEIIRRHNGRIAFQKEDLTRGCFSILLQVLSDEPVTPKIALGA